ncbi:hypothetical protein [Natronorubrum tibetense]|uniref:Cox cluster protein n=1 Tax=Natronorubrum tibetense GA33 TaxID=1114856 RepID=L9VXP5_9EURY|nr:hypothetical protein [Natronorubrum tibetense]ELY41802.1 hypothetical protein C496_08406 [Natronorubrum tibetense GA33]
MLLTRSLVRFLFTASILLLLLLAFAAPFIEPDSGEAVVATLSLIPIALTLLGTAIVIVTGWDPSRPTAD